MENYRGRYIKVLKKNLGGLDYLYEVGDYLKILGDTGKLCIVVEHAGTLNIRAYSNRITNGDIEMMPVGFIPEFVLPKKWCVKITKDNIDKAKALRYRELGFQYDYNYSIGGYYTPFDNSAFCHGLSCIPSDLTEITWEQFETYVLNKSKFFPVLDKFPISGCCESLDPNFLDFLDKHFKTSNLSITPNTKGIGWNSYGYWALVNVKHSSKKEFDISQLEPFYKKSESYLEFVERLRKENKKEQEEKQLIYKISNNEKSRTIGYESSKSTKICRFDIKIRQASPIRGDSLRGSKSKIRIRSDNSHY